MKNFYFYYKFFVNLYAKLLTVLILENSIFNIAFNSDLI